MRPPWASPDLPPDQSHSAFCFFGRFPQSAIIITALTAIVLLERLFRQLSSSVDEVVPSSSSHSQASVPAQPAPFLRSGSRLPASALLFRR